MELIFRFFTPPEDHFFLLGPRGTGKSFFLRQTFPTALRVDLLDPGTHRSLAAKPERLGEIIAAHPGAEDVVIDEVQKLPILLEVVHQTIAKGGGPRFILTGSSARKLRHGGVNLLGGRALDQRLHPFLAGELGSNFNLEKALRLGLIPLVWGAKNPEETLRGYNSLYLREEVQMEGMVRDIGHFSRFLETLAFSHGGILNLANVGRDCQVKRKTAEGYLEVLEDLLIGFRLPIFNLRPGRELAAHAKFYFFDAGVFRANRLLGPLHDSPDVEGAALEGMVAQHLRAYVDYSRGPHRLYYWQTRSRLEVDFVIYGEGLFAAIEVKNSERLRPEHFRALKNFGEDYPEARRILLYRGQDRFVQDGIRCTPCEEFLRELRPNGFPGG